METGPHTLHDERKSAQQGPSLNLTADGVRGPIESGSSKPENCL